MRVGLTDGSSGKGLREVARSKKRPETIESVTVEQGFDCQNGTDAGRSPALTAPFGARGDEGFAGALGDAAGLVKSEFPRLGVAEHAVISDVAPDGLKHVAPAL